MKNFAFVPSVPGPVLETFQGEELFDLHPDVAALWVECPAAVGVGDIYDGASFAPPSGQISTSARWAALQMEALGALAESDITVLRCAEAGVPVPQAWRDYRAALRQIVSSDIGDPDPGLPERPAYPPGT